jgi:hypothetical protein
MDAQMVTAIFTALAAFAALGTAIAAFLQIRMSRQSISVDVLLRLDAHFNSPDMKAIRRKAASFLLQRFNPHLVLPDTKTSAVLPLMTSWTSLRASPSFPCGKARPTQKASGAFSLATLTTTCMQQRNTFNKRKRMTQCSGKNLFAFTTNLFLLSESIIRKAMNLPTKTNFAASLKMRCRIERVIRYAKRGWQACLTE